jgi:hypothetical protein
MAAMIICSVSIVASSSASSPEASEWPSVPEFAFQGGSPGGVQSEPGQQLRTFGGVDLLAEPIFGNAGFSEHAGLASPYCCRDLLSGPGDQRFKFGSERGTENQPGSRAGRASHETADDDPCTSTAAGSKRALVPFPALTSPALTSIAFSHPARLSTCAGMTGR